MMMLGGIDTGDAKTWGRALIAEDQISDQTALRSVPAHAAIAMEWGFTSPDASASG